MKEMKKEDVVEQLATGQMSRRQFNQSLMALGATMVMMPMVSILLLIMTRWFVLRQLSKVFPNYVLHSILRVVLLLLETLQQSQMVQLDF